ncbi:MAG TPA: hypothetical protein VLT47_03560 [Anaeromyxobacteraceae bacterium]|nr:hypothetical protein [Anaeromyxobacteraceae bacterium]
MRRTLALVIAALLPAAAHAEPLDIDLGQLGAPDARVWVAAGYTPSFGDATLAAADAKARFGMLSSELALALTTSLLTPGSTTGHSGFDIALEGAYGGVHVNEIGTATGTYDTASGSVAFGPRNYWPTRGLTPNELFVPGVRIRKALPFSFELGARFKYVSQSALYAGQLETKWAFFEGDRVLPDFALRIAYTRAGGVRTLNLATTDFDFVVSKRWGVLGVVSLTPYGALRFTYMRASSEPIVFFPDATAGTQEARTASFPRLTSTFFRPTLGLRMTTYALSLAAEITQYGGGEFRPAGYPTFRVKPSLAGSFRLGFEF